MTIRKTAATLAVALLASAGAITVTGCSSQGGAAEARVRDYLASLAAGDAAKAHELNPYSAVLSAEGAAASAAGGHLSVVKVEGFVEAKDTFDVPTAVPTPTASSSTGPDWTGIDWDDQSWSGQEGSAQMKDVKKVTTGFVPVTFKLGDAERTVPIGIAFGQDSTGAEQFAFRSVALNSDQAAQFGMAKAVPALAPASVKLAHATTEEDGSDSDGTAEEETPWWQKAEQRVDEATTELARDATLSGAKVALSEESLLLLPGTYEVVVGQPADDALWGATAPASENVTLQPGDEHQVKLGPATVTEAGKKHVQDVLEKLAQDKYDAMVKFEISDRDQACGLLAPASGWGSSSSDFEDDWFTASSTNIASGGITVEAKSSNKTTGTKSGNGSSDTFADEAFCAGKADAEATSYTVPVEVVSSSLTPGSVTVNNDGTFTTTSPWTLAMETKVSSYDNTDAAGQNVGWGKPKVKTTYTATVNITWSPTGALSSDGELKPADSE